MENILPIYEMWFDGGSRGNSDRKAAAAYIIELDGEAITQKGIYIGDKTCNEAEWTAIIEGLKRAIQLKIEILVVRGDSDLVIKAINSERPAPDPRMRELQKEALQLKHRIKNIIIRHIPRELNKNADRIVNYTLDTEANGGKDWFRS